MMLTPTLTLTIVTMVFSQSRLTERRLGDLAVIGIPRSVKEEMYKGVRDEQMGRLIYSFATTYFWASFGSGQAYKHQLFVSLMAPDATDAEYDELPVYYNTTYDPRRRVHDAALGSGRLRVSEGTYRQNSLQEPSRTFVYTDRTKRLQIVWHAVNREIDLASGIATIGKMAASFRLVGDPTARFAEMRDRPRREAEAHANRRELAFAMLLREGYGPLQPGKPVLKNGVHVEWMSDPEPRYQLLVPLGKIETNADASRASRPRPVRPVGPDGQRITLAGSIGWRENIDGEWEVSNNDNAYLPFPGIAEALGAKQSDPNFTYFYYAATVRVEQEDGDARLTSLRWFLDGVPEVRKLWADGKLTRGGTPISLPEAR